MTLRSVLSRTIRSRDQIEADEERAEPAGAGCAPVCDLPDRRRGRARGVVRSVTLRPRGAVSALEAELYDGTGTIDLVWLGRRRIAGVEVGRRVEIEGLVCTVDGRRTVFNPHYTLRPRP